MFEIKKSTLAAALSRRSDRDLNVQGTLWLVGACLVTLLTLFLPGCSNPATAHAVDPPQAREALKLALDGWKNGESPRSFESSSPPMVIQDVDWLAGAKLSNYEIIDEGKAEDANLRVRVNLTLSSASASGKSQPKMAEKKVWYLVTTSPKVTVFRDMLRR